MIEDTTIRFLRKCLRTQVKSKNTGEKIVLSSLRSMVEKLRALETERKNLILEIEELKKLAESKTRALESEVGMLREEVESLRILLGAETIHPQKTEPQRTRAEEPSLPPPPSKPEKAEEGKSKLGFLKRKEK
jgi:uncharacterized protein (UPF0335 family)